MTSDEIKAKLEEMNKVMARLELIESFDYDLDRANAEMKKDPGKYGYTATDFPVDETVKV